MLWPQDQTWPAHSRPPNGAARPDQPPWGYQHPSAQHWAQAYPWASPARRRSPVVAVVLLSIIAWIVAALGIPAVIAYVATVHDPFLDHGSSHAGLTTVPADISSVRFKPGASDRAFFRAVGFNGAKNTVVTKWTRSVVHVWIAGLAQPSDRRVLTRVVAMVNRADEGRPRFVVGDADAEIRITFQQHAAFVAGQKWGDRAAGVCLFDYSVPGFALASAQIRIDDALPASTGERQATLYHEFGHAVGLTDATADRWRDTIMFHQTGGPSSYTRLDLAVIRMLYDPRVTAGESRPDVMATWRHR
jgi:Protein of unknown function (DUF2927)